MCSCRQQDACAFVAHRYACNHNSEGGASQHYACIHTLTIRPHEHCQTVCTDSLHLKHNCCVTTVTTSNSRDSVDCRNKQPSPEMWKSVCKTGVKNGYIPWARDLEFLYILRFHVLCCLITVRQIICMDSSITSGSQCIHKIIHPWIHPLFIMLTSDNLGVCMASGYVWRLQCPTLNATLWLL